MNHSDIIKTSIVRCTKPPQPGIEIEVIQTETIITNQKEKWSIAVATHAGDSCELLELSSISITMPGGKVWRGTIQDFMMIFSVASHAHSSLSQPSISVNDRIVAEELKCVLSHVEPLGVSK